jgi:O-antigen/teichoic acid export membrane protein
MPVVMSVFERIISRGSTAIITLLLAVFTGPEFVGKYATVILAVTIYQTLTDGVIRQIGVEAWNFYNGKVFVRKSSALSGGAGFVIVATGVWAVTANDFSWQLLLALLPLVFVPLVTCQYLGILTRAQRTPSGWTRIAKSQSLASLFSLAAAVPLLPLLGIGAASIQLLASELIFLAFISRKPDLIPQTRGWAPLWKGYYFPTAVSSVLGWGQSQLERLILVVLAAPGTVGMYSLAVAIARSASDAITSGLVNAIRSQIASESSLESREHHLRRGIKIGLKISLPMQLVVTVASLYLFPVFLDASWSDALLTAPVFAATGVFAAVIWVTSSYVITIGQSKRLITAQVAGILLSIACGYLLNVSLFAGALMCIVRDSIGLFLRLYIVRKSLDFRFISIIVAALLASVLLGLGSQFVNAYQP